MTKIDPEKERQRLASLYADMSDLELQKIGKNPESLTDWAFEALREEMTRRGLDWSGKDMPLPSQVVHSTPVEDDPGNRPIVLRKYRDMPEAFVAKSLLEDAGIQSFLQDDNVVRMDWFWSNAIGGIKLVVRQKDAEQSEKLLAATPGDGDGKGIKTQNSEMLDSLIEYCQAHPDQRFWQALRNWSGWQHVLVSNDSDFVVSQTTVGKVHDTFNWEGLKGNF